MKLIEDIESYGSVGIVGLAKNAGKTECLNYILKRLALRHHPTALTSIGLDGETTDAVSRTPKPEITVYQNMWFATSERHYRSRRLTSEIQELSVQQTSLGRVVTAKAVTSGKVIISGPADTASMRKLIYKLHAHGAKTVLIDGALSRLSPASPTVAEAMILATGAAVSATIKDIVSQTGFVCSLMQLPQTNTTLTNKLDNISSGIWGIDKVGNIHDLDIVSTFALDKNRDKIFSKGTTLFCSGAVSDRFLKFITQQKQIADVKLIVRDFTRIFTSQSTFAEFQRRGGKIELLHRNKLLAICINPVSPRGFKLDSDRLVDNLQSKVTVPVYDLMKHGHILCSPKVPVDY